MVVYYTLFIIILVCCIMLCHDTLLYFAMACSIHWNGVLSYPRAVDYSSMIDYVRLCSIVVCFSPLCYAMSHNATVYHIRSYGLHDIILYQTILCSWLHTAVDYVLLSSRLYCSTISLDTILGHSLLDRDILHQLRFIWTSSMWKHFKHIAAHYITC